MTSTAELAQALAACRTTGQVLPAAPWAQAVLDEAQAYAVQDGVAALLGWAPAGAPVRHWKSGGASRSGPFSHSPLDPAGIGRVRTTWPLLGIEAEIALRLGRDVTPDAARDMQPGQADEWLDAMALSVELVASRWQEGLAAPALLRMADHQSHGALLLGPWQPYRRLDWAYLNWRLSQQDGPTVERRGGHSLDDPAWLLPAWLQHLCRDGLTVPAGTVVTTGAWGGMQALAAGHGDRIRVELSFDTLGTCSFEWAG
ncbi:fumarylacetoacetate hydrolase family protein [Ideonella sp. BN130291]|uniref:fumarylacetoacetate hydrolase family protein n=1 Tax=Ideonella sp. BN130291 TaxID=3112940 RepID=UPI002E2532CF|nr:fumarylacetoacetate hydrolase family protein [Ideonella sp. BN130291]